MPVDPREAAPPVRRARSSTGLTWEALSSPAASPWGGPTHPLYGDAGRTSWVTGWQEPQNDWRQAQETRDYEVPDYVDSLLTAAGYTRKDAAPEAEADTTALNMKAAQPLTKFRRSMDEEQFQQYLDAYGDRYNAPKDAGQPSHWKRPVVATEEVTAAPMTPKAYNALTPEQRAAVDFNTALIAAREEDLKSGWMIRRMPEEARAEYQKMFGEDAPTAGFAESTHRLLRKVGYTGEADMEDFLSLEMATDIKDLKNLKFDEKLDLSMDSTPRAQRDDTPGESRRHASFYNQDESMPEGGWDAFRRTGSQEYRDVMLVDVVQKARKVLEGFRSNSMYSSRANALTAFDMGTGGETLPLGFGDPATRTDARDVLLEKVYQGTLTELIGNPERNKKLADDPVFWAGLQKLGVGEKDIDGLFSFLDASTRWAIQHGEKSGDGARTPQQIRVLAGLEPVK